MSSITWKPRPALDETMSTPDRSRELTSLRLKIAENPRKYFSKFSDYTRDALKNFIAEYLRNRQWPKEETFPALLNIPDEVGVIRSLSRTELTNEIFPALDRNLEASNNLITNLGRRIREEIRGLLN